LREGLFLLFETVLAFFERRSWLAQFVAFLVGLAFNGLAFLKRIFLRVQFGLLDDVSASRRAFVMISVAWVWLLLMRRRSARRAPPKPRSSPRSRARLVKRIAKGSSPPAHSFEEREQPGRTGDVRREIVPTRGTARRGDNHQQRTADRPPNQIWGSRQPVTTVARAVDRSNARL